MGDVTEETCTLRHVYFTKKQKHGGGHLSKTWGWSFFVREMVLEVEVKKINFFQNFGISGVSTKKTAGRMTSRVRRPQHRMQHKIWNIFHYHHQVF